MLVRCSQKEMNEMNFVRFVVAIARARRAGLLRLRRADGPLFFRCLGSSCRLCCEIGGGAVVRDGPAKTSRDAVMPSHKGSCAALSNGRCMIYSDRPQGCRDYPWYNISGDLYYDSGCPGVRIGGDARPLASSIAAAQNYFVVPRWLQFICLQIVVRW
jgi:Fe-S-cluster containining protein